MGIKKILKIYILLFLTITIKKIKNSSCDVNESGHELGPHKCRNDDDCGGDRTCSQWQWCQGESNCPPKETTTTPERNCNIDEADNKLGPNKCSVNSECSGDRTCSSSSWCQGESNCQNTVDGNDSKNNNNNELNNVEEKSASTSKGALIAGIIVAVCILIIILVLIFYCCIKKGYIKKKKKVIDHNSSNMRVTQNNNTELLHRNSRLSRPSQISANTNLINNNNIPDINYNYKNSNNTNYNINNNIPMHYNLNNNNFNNNNYVNNPYKNNIRNYSYGNYNNNNINNNNVLKKGNLDYPSNENVEYQKPKAKPQAKPHTKPIVDNNSKTENNVFNINRNKLENYKQ